MFRIIPAFLLDFAVQSGYHFLIDDEWQIHNLGEEPRYPLSDDDLKVVAERIKSSVNIDNNPQYLIHRNLIAEYHGFTADERNFYLIRIPERLNQISEDFLSKAGTGLGLTLTRKFVNLLSGEITVESTLIKGTAFSLRFPVRQNRGGVNPSP